MHIWFFFSANQSQIKTAGCTHIKIPTLIRFIALPSALNVVGLMALMFRVQVTQICYGRFNTKDTNHILETLITRFSLTKVICITCTRLVYSEGLDQINVGNIYMLVTYYYQICWNSAHFDMISKILKDIRNYSIAWKIAEEVLF